MKCQERLCGAAQLEIAIQTKENLNRYINAVKEMVMKKFIIIYYNILKGQDAHFQVGVAIRHVYGELKMH